MKASVIGPVCRDRPDYSPGGVTYYTGNALHSLGVETTVYSSFGRDDDFSDSFRCRLVHIPAEETLIFSHEYPDTTNPDIRVSKAVRYRNSISPEDITDDLSNIDYNVLGPLFPDNIPKELVDKIKGNGKIVLAAQGLVRDLDGDLVVRKKPEDLEILQHTDYLFLNKEEMLIISGRGDIQDGARYLKDNGARAIIVTQGKSGSRLFLENLDLKIRAYHPRGQIDPTGAGDSYLAGFIVAQDIPEFYEDPYKQGEFAAMVSTICMENQGPFNKDRDYVFERLRKHGIQF